MFCLLDEAMLVCRQGIHILNTAFFFCFTCRYFDLRRYKIESYSVWNWITFFNEQPHIKQWPKICASRMLRFIRQWPLKSMHWNFIVQRLRKHSIFWHQLLLQFSVKFQYEIFLQAVPRFPYHNSDDNSTIEIFLSRLKENNEINKSLWDKYMISVPYHYRSKLMYR